MRPLLALGLLALLTASLAGCADDPERYPGGGPSASRTSTTGGPGGGASTGTATSSTTTTGGPGGDNQPPTGSISVAVNGTNATFTLTGNDPDGDAIVWDLDFGDGNATNGTGLPALVNHTYAPTNTTGNATGNATGNITAVFTVSDGVEQANYTINVTLAAGGVTQEFAGGWEDSNGHCLGQTSTTVPPSLWFPAPAKAATYESFAVDAETHGAAFLVTYTFAEGSTGGITFTDAAGAYLQRSLTGDTPTISGIVPPGAATAYLFSCLSEPDPVTAAYSAG